MAGEARNSNLIHDATCFDMYVRKLLKSDKEPKWRVKDEYSGPGTSRWEYPVAKGSQNTDKACDAKCTVRDLSR